MSFSQRLGEFVAAAPLVGDDRPPVRVVRRR